MVRRRVWFERHFPLGLPADAFPDILERLRGTPARVEERVRGASRDVLIRRTDDRWSAQENVGHLFDLEALWLARVEDLAAGRPTLTPADLTNRATHQADHNARPIAELLAAFRSARGALVARLEQLADDAIVRTARHPRLQHPMSAVDHAFFVAEHDDHHLARIGELLRV